MLITNEEFEEWKGFCKRRGWSDNTVKQYDYYVKGLLGVDFSQDVVNREMERRSKNNYVSFITAFCECFNIDVKITHPRRLRRTWVIHYFTEEEMKKIYENVKKLQLNLIIRLMYELGLRVSEVMNLQRKNFDMVNKRVKGIGKGNKPFNKPFVSEETYEKFTIWLENVENREDYVLRYKGIKNQRKKVYDELRKKISEILPYKDPKEIHPHAFRSSCATILMDKGMNLREIQVYLRHSSLETVGRYAAAKDKKITEKATNAFGGQGNE